MSDEKNTCGNCHYCQEQKGDPMQQGINSTVLNCFRFPPSANSAPVGAPGGGVGIMSMTTRPQVQADAPACGEWKAKQSLN